MPVLPQIPGLARFLHPKFSPQSKFHRPHSLTVEKASAPCQLVAPLVPRALGILYFFFGLITDYTSLSLNLCICKMGMLTSTSG